MPSLFGRSSRARQHSSTSSRAALASTKTEVIIHVYDLLPAGRLSSVLWAFGSGLLHSGVVIRDREYAYGGHNQRGMTGVYWTRPRQEPPGGRFRCDILQGFTFRTEPEIAAIIQAVSEQFLGPSYNLLTRNCNHFTSALCQALTSKPAPSWLNRAASIGLAMPCMVPKEWITPPDAETADGELLGTDSNILDSDDQLQRSDADEEDTDDALMVDERVGMMDGERRREQRRREIGRKRYSKKGSGTSAAASAADTTPASQDAEGRTLPVAERAPA